MRVSKLIKVVDTFEMELHIYLIKRYDFVLVIRYIMFKGKIYFCSFFFFLNDPCRKYIMRFNYKM